jgi:HSP90 family molecular chaperone
MKTVNTGETPSRRTRFQYRPDRAYVLAERQSQSWDGTQLDDLLDEVDAEGNDAYTVEADGSKGADERRFTRSSRTILLSCSKEYHESKLQDISRRSKQQASHINTKDDEGTESIQELSALSFDALNRRAAEVAALAQV